MVSDLNPTPYVLSFTGASLAIRESVKLAEAYLELNDWEAVREKVWAENLLQARTRSSIQRTLQELQPRLEQLDPTQLELLVEGNPHEQQHLLWYAICRRYAYIQEFAIEVLHEKFLRMDYELTEFDYDAFFNRKADWHEELEKLKDSTRQKIKTRVFRMLLEAGLITEDNRIIPCVLSQRVIASLAPSAPTSYQIFPISEADLTT